MAICVSKPVSVLVALYLSMSLASTMDGLTTTLDRTNKTLLYEVRYWCDNRCLLETDGWFCGKLNNNLKTKHGIQWEYITKEDCMFSNASEENYNPSTTTTTTIPHLNSQDSTINIETTRVPPFKTDPTTNDFSTTNSGSVTETVNEQQLISNDVDHDDTDSESTYIECFVIFIIITLIFLCISIGWFAKKCDYQHFNKADSETITLETIV